MQPDRRPLVTPLTLEVVREPAHIDHLQAEWNRFVAAMPGATAFQLPEWQSLWWRHFGAGSLHIMLFRSVDTLVGILPCHIHDREVRLIGSGMGGLLEPPILKTRQSEIMTLLKGHLVANAAWRTAHWHNLQPNSPLLTLNLGDAFALTSQPDTEFAELPLEGTFQKLWETRPFSLRRNFLKYLDKSAFADRPRFEMVDQADPEFVNAIIRLQPPEFDAAKDGPAVFISDLARIFDKADLLRIFGLRFQGKIVAAALAIVYRGTVYAIVSGHDPAFETHAFRRVLLFECLRHAFEQGYRAWNFRRNDEPDQVLWGARVAATTQLTIQRNS